MSNGLRNCVFLLHSVNGDDPLRGAIQGAFEAAALSGCPSSKGQQFETVCGDAVRRLVQRFPTWAQLAAHLDESLGAAIAKLRTRMPTDVRRALEEEKLGVDAVVNVSDFEAPKVLEQQLFLDRGSDRKVKHLFQPTTLARPGQ